MPKEQQPVDTFKLALKYKHQLREQFERVNQAACMEVQEKLKGVNALTRVYNALKGKRLWPHSLDEYDVASNLHHDDEELYKTGKFKNAREMLAVRNIYDQDVEYSIAKDFRGAYELYFAASLIHVNDQFSRKNEPNYQPILSQSAYDDDLKGAMYACGGFVMNLVVAAEHYLNDFPQDDVRFANHQEFESEYVCPKGLLKRYGKGQDVNILKPKCV